MGNFLTLSSLFEQFIFPFLHLDIIIIIIIIIIMTSLVLVAPACYISCSKSKTVL